MDLEELKVRISVQEKSLETEQSFLQQQLRVVVGKRSHCQQQLRAAEVVERLASEFENSSRLPAELASSLGPVEIGQPAQESVAISNFAGKANKVRDEKDPLDVIRERCKARLAKENLAVNWY